MENQEQSSITKAINKFTRDLYKKGYWQIIMFILIEQTVYYTCAFIMLSGTFTSGKMNFYCNISKEYTNKTQLYANKNKCTLINKESNKTTNCTTGFIFKPINNFVKTSIYEDFELICDRKFLDGLPQSMVMLGLFIGGIFGPILADKFGRRLVVFGSIFVAGIFGIGLSFVNNFYLLLFFNLILGIMRETILSVGFVFGLEFIPDTHQSYYGMISQVLWSSNIIILGIMAYFIRKWRYLQLFGSIPILAMSLLIIIVPESPRWLITTAHFDTLRILIDNFVNKINRDKISSWNTIERLKKAYVQHMKQFRNKKDATKYTGMDIIKSKVLVRWTIVLILTWSYMVITYFSLTILTVHLPGNKYFVFILPVCFEIPGYFIAYFSILRSRNITFFTAQIIISLCLITVGYIDDYDGWTSISLMVTAKLCLAGSFYITVITAIYIFPTTMRSFGTSLPSSLSKLLGVTIPYFVKLYTVYSWLPIFLMGFGAIIIGVINIFYPDWVNRPLPETLRELKQLKTQYGFKFRKINNKNSSQNENDNRN